MYPSLMIAVLWLVFTAYWLISAFGTKKSLPGSKRRGSAIRILFIVVFWVVFLNPAVRRYVGHPLSVDPFTRIAGVLICAAGMAFAFWARMHLGRNWGVYEWTKLAPLPHSFSVNGGTALPSPASGTRATISAQKSRERGAGAQQQFGFLIGMR